MSWKDNTIMLWDGQKVSDHGRSELGVQYENIEAKERMIDGTMRRNLVATKRTFSTSWENLPSKTIGEYGPLDGGMSGEEMKIFVDEAEDPIWVTLRDGAGTEEMVYAFIDAFTWDITKRGQNIDLWNVSVTLIEV